MLISWPVIILAILVLLVIGLKVGQASVEYCAILHSDCKGPMFMKGRFFYIVPEGRYVAISCPRPSYQEFQTLREIETLTREIIGRPESEDRDMAVIMLSDLLDATVKPQPAGERSGNSASRDV